MCHFYPSRQVLLEALVPYFLAGIDNNERGLWIAAPPLPAAEVREEISKYPRMEQSVASGQLWIQDALEWYGDSVSLDPEKILHRWFEEEERAIADGYQGIRITANTSFIPQDKWDSFLNYEERLHQQIRQRRIIACCSYHREICRPIDFLEVARLHDATFDRPDQHWQVFVQATRAG